MLPLAYEGEKESRNSGSDVEDDDDNVVIPPAGQEASNDDDRTSSVNGEARGLSFDSSSRSSCLSSALFAPTSDELGNINCLSQRESRLSRITTTEARNRSYLVGSACSRGSLLGAEQLNAYFPERIVTLFVGTWNTNSVSEPPLNLDEFLLPLCIDNIPDVFAVGTQENMLPRHEWETTMQETIGLSHVLLHSVVLGTLHLAVFIRRELIWFCSEPEEAVLGTRQGTTIRTKGAVAVALQLFGTSFLFINSHLTAHDRNVNNRIGDYRKILSGLELPRKFPSKADTHEQEKDVTKNFDCTFWFGDLNFRLALDRDKVIEQINSFSCNYESILKTDQLSGCMDKGDAFMGFAEHVIRFPPSYKFDVGTDRYDTSSKQRTPAYTDRILFHMRRKNTISCCHYSSVPSVRTSDHKPVYGVFRVNLRPGRDNVPLAAGQFMRSIYLKAVERRALLLDPLYNQKGSRLCRVM